MKNSSLTDLLNEARTMKFQKEEEGGGIIMKEILNKIENMNGD